jgi:uncharacterized protein (DUF952 family)
MNQRTILHLVSQSEWEAALPLDDYLPSAFAADGFIHCTHGEDELLAVANRFYRQVPGEFLVLEIEESKVTAPIKWERPPQPFGHHRHQDVSSQQDWLFCKRFNFVNLRVST